MISVCSFFLIFIWQQFPEGQRQWLWKMCGFSRHVAPCMLLPAQLLLTGLLKTPPVILTPTATASVIHSLLSVCVWPCSLQQSCCFSRPVLPSLKVSDGSYPWHCSLVVTVVCLLSFWTSNSCWVDLTLTQLQLKFLPKNCVCCTQHGFSSPFLCCVNSVGFLQV